jgi:hypothetical protein
MANVGPSAKTPPAFSVVAGKQDPAGAGTGCDPGEVSERGKTRIMANVGPSAKTPPAFSVLAGEQDPAGAGTGCDPGEVSEWDEEGVGCGSGSGTKDTGGGKYYFLL